MKAIKRKSPLPRTQHGHSSGTGSGHHSFGSAGHGHHGSGSTGHVHHGSDDLHQRKKHTNAVRMSDKSFNGSDYEKSMHEFEEEFTEVEFDYEMDNEEMYEYGTTSKTVRMSDTTTRKLCPLDEDFFDTRISTISISDDTSEDTIETIESYKQVELEKQEDFFDKFGKVPDLRQISADTLASQMARTSTQQRRSKLLGKFVDPLTGLTVRSDEGSEQMSEEILPEEENKKEEVIDPDKIILADACPIFEEFSFEAFDHLYPTIDVKSIVKCAEEEGGDLTFLFTKKDSQPEVPALLLPHKRRTLSEEAQHQTKDFLSELLNSVVRFCEFERNAEKVRNNLDKCALFHEVKKLVFEIDVEKRVNTFLNTKCVEYYRRKGNMRQLQEEKPEHILQDMAYYKEKSDILNVLLGKEWAMTKKVQKNIFDLSVQADEEEEANHNEVLAFENLVKKTIKCHLNPAFEKFVSTQLRHMATLREEISATRALVIQRQHNLGTLRARILELESIGNGLRLADYESLQRETSALAKKLEDRNRDLLKMHARFYHNLHSMAHIKLKNELTIGTISEQLKHLRELEEVEYLTRQRIFYMNLNHQVTRRQLNDLSLRSGLLDKPALLRDYDETMESLMKKRAKIQEMKKNREELISKLKQLNVTATSQAKNTPKADKSKSLKHKSAALKPIEGLAAICLNF